MAKRYEPFKEFGRSIKKPKLDISISRAKPQSTTERSKASGITPAQSRFKPPPSNAAQCSPNNFWDDDDDDVILLATQMAETQVATSAKLTQTQMKESEITFSEFAPNVHATTSTQRITEVIVEVPFQDLLSDMFNDDDDDDFAQLALEGVEQQKQQFDHHVNNPKSQATFKKPDPPPANEPSTSTKALQELTLTQAITVANDMPCSQSTARRQLASERQIKFLMERVDALKKENLKLSKDLSDTKGDMESKEGESALLRDELRHMKQQIQSIKMDKIFSTEAAKSECKTKIAELSKQVEAKQAELQLKTVEFSVLKMRHADETRRFETSMRNESMVQDEIMPQASVDVPPIAKLELPEISIRKLMRLRALRVPEHSFPSMPLHGNAVQLTSEIFEQAHERGTMRNRRTLFQIELEVMHKIVAQLQLKAPPLLSTEQEKEFVNKTISSACKVFSEFWTYVHSLEFLKNCHIHPYCAYDLANDQNDTKTCSIHQPTEMHVEERAISLRRYVAALSIVCRKVPSVCKSLLTFKHGEYLLLQIAIDAINKLGFSLEISEHYGLLEAFTELLYSLMLHVGTADTNCTDLLIALLKSIIFCRPNPWVFQRISLSMLQCVRVPEMLKLLCVNSDANSFLIDRLHSMYRFSMESCIIQVYAGLLEIAFPLYTTLQPIHFKLLAKICENHVRFVYLCFEEPPKFIHDQLPNYEDDDNSNEETKSNAADTSKQSIDVDSLGTVPNSSKKGHSNAAKKRDKAGIGETTVDQNMEADNVAKTTTNEVITINSSVTTSESSSMANATNQEIGSSCCECYTQLCLSLVTLLFQLLRQWELKEKALETSRVAQISKISVKLLHTIFCDNYITRLFRDAEETTKHYLYLICKWWSDNAELFNFNDIHKNFLQKLQKSHIMPKQLSDEQNLANVEFDLSEWYRTTSDDSKDADTAACSTKTAEEIADNLKLIEDAFDSEKFFEGLKGYAFNFE